MNKAKKVIEKWFWMMKYCKDKEIPPAQQWAWKEAENKYKQMEKNTH